MTDLPEPISMPARLNFRTDTTERPRGITVTSPDDPAYALLQDGVVTEPVPGVHRSDCYICRDPEFAMMGLPLCKACPDCTRRYRELHPDKPDANAGHVPADDVECSECGFDIQEEYYRQQEEAKGNG